VAKSELWLWGKHSTASALQNKDRSIKRLLLTSENRSWLESILKKLPKGRKQALDACVQIVSKSAIDRCIGYGCVHQGMALNVFPLPSLSLEACLSTLPPKAILVALDQVTDPQNVGSMMRTTLALGGQALLLCAQNTPPLDGVVAKAASGALDRLPLYIVPNLARAIKSCKDRNVWTWGLDERGEPIRMTHISSQRSLLVVGAEGKGLRPFVRGSCDGLVRLPTLPSFPTLNASIALAVGLYALQYGGQKDEDM
jgi:23S rRNA (guanosine2251-2'-O)-methyltransferase